MCDFQFILLLQGKVRAEDAPQGTGRAAAGQRTNDLEHLNGPVASALRRAAQAQEIDQALTIDRRMRFTPPIGL